MKDERTLQELLHEAYLVQNASVLSGVVHGWSRALTRLRELLPNVDTDEINHHHINVLWSDKCAHLTGTQTDSTRLSAAYDAYFASQRDDS